jgi:2-polyprenyl-3-methyl-5-hydroxy-6-metoxy-1,4-benzoquinol methylase
MKAYESPDRLPRFGSLRTILELVGNDRDVLDVGCAEGQLARHDTGGNRFWGVDFNAQSLEAARPYYSDVARVDLNAYAGEPIFGGKRFDAVVFADVLEHLLDPRTLLRSSAEMLKPGGSVIVSLPNIALWRVRLNLLFGRFEYTKYGVMDDTHLRFYTFASARRFVEEAGYDVDVTLGAANELGLIARKVRPLRNLASINVIMKCQPRA